jgi:hypothetical protein
VEREEPARCFTGIALVFQPVPATDGRFAPGRRGMQGAVTTGSDAKGTVGDAIRYAWCRVFHDRGARRPSLSPVWWAAAPPGRE